MGPERGAEAASGSRATATVSAWPAAGMPWSNPQTPGAPRQQRKKEETKWRYYEQEILRLLIRYGSVVLSRVSDRETARRPSPP
ncbi:MAG: hypothetical protein U5L72_17815 [Bacteroidales bacterium]|nr:hypothetical protein [Bacteroidales bacterium]